MVYEYIKYLIVGISQKYKTNTINQLVDIGYSNMPK